MTQEQNIDDVLTQMSNAILAIARVQAQLAPDLLHAHLGGAVKASQASGVGDALIMELYQKTFPGRDLPIGYSLDIPNPNA